MANIRPNDLPTAGSVPADAAIMIDNGVSVEKATPLQVTDAARPLASQADAEAGADNVKIMSSLRVKQAIDVLRAALLAAGGADLIGAIGGDTAQDKFTALDPLITLGTAQTLGTRLARLNLPTSGAGAVYAFGTNGPNAGANFNGLQIGGGDALWGTEGVYVGGDGHPVWLRWQPTRNYSPIENVIYPTAAQGHAQKVNGTNQLTYVDGSTFDPAWVGRKIYWGTETYRVASAAGSTITVTTTAGAPIVFSGSATAIYHVFYVYGTGICNVSGSTVTHVSGDPFLYFAADPAHELKINGTTRAVSSGAGAPYTLTLSAPPGDVTGATYEYFTDIDDTMVQLRLQKFLGSTEENITKGVKPWCYFERTQAAGGGLHYPVHYGSGDGKAQITLMPDGTTRFGWHGSIANPNVDTTNYFELDSATTGINPAFRARGVDTNIGLGFDTKGTGAVTFTSGSFGRINFRIYGSNAPDYLVTDAATGAPFLAAEGASATIDIPIIPKGAAGRVRFGTFVAHGDVAITGHLEIKDVGGVIRKLAIVA